ncbi:MAG: enoyl-CoA hydratase/isomerase family protein [Gammaproteobacteria bacterium]|nr:enoyl-CoA hydratase/isomerase family protein [Gammaproteobacteria bacterium]
MSESARADEHWRHWHVTREQDGIAWIDLDVAGARVNTLSAAVLAELESLLHALDAEPPAAAVLRSGKPGGFIAGADVNEFVGLVDAAAAEASVARVHAVMNRLEALPFPTLALIHGHCVGGGLELALACRYRIASDDAATRLGLPEVLLGIHPGFGGCARSVRTVGVFAAMDLMLSGRQIDARRAGRIGLVDEVVAERHLARAARAWIASGRPRRHAPWYLRAANLAPVRAVIAAVLERQVARRVARAHYPAPFALIELWRRHGGRTASLLLAEPHSVAQLVTGVTSANLVRLFLLRERLRAAGRDVEHGIRHVHVVGAGIMGADIAAWCALQGFEVTLQDRGPKEIAPALERAERWFARRVRDPHRRQGVRDRLHPDPAGAGVARADIVIEAIIENVQAKQDLYATLEPRLRDDALLATNTSSIRLEDLQAGLERPERLVGLHFFNPVSRMEVVEVIGARDTAPDALARALAFTRAIGKLPLPVRSAPGFLVNRCLLPYMLEAVCLVEEGRAIEVVDRAARDFGMPLGPVELADTVGLDVCLAVGEMVAPRFGTELPELLREKVRRGHLGRKVGHGFYSYRAGRPTPRRVAVPQDIDEVCDRLLLRFLNEAVACLDEGIVGDADLLDAGLVFGTGFAPFRGGALRYVQAAGAGALRRRLEDLARAHGPRFTPHPGWARLEESPAPPVRAPS